jgi:hypothetical protein
MLPLAILRRMTEWEHLVPEEPEGTDSATAREETGHEAALCADAEIEPETGSEAIQEPEAGENAVAETGCQIRMGKGICGRPFHGAPEGVDERRVCLMHSKDPGKLSGALFALFWSEFEEILEAAGDQAAHFDRFVFPTLNLMGKSFSAFCSFNEATFARGADFRGAVFTRSAEFIKATFTGNAIFSGTLFMQKARFSRAVFAQNATFLGTTFTLVARFDSASFRHNANFRRATFLRTVRFSDVTFTQKANFSNATFTLDASFQRATFTRNAAFSSAIFEQKANFRQADFVQNGSFFNTRFTQCVDFSSTTFAQDADFRGATFAQSADFSRADFTQNTTFLSAAFTQNADFSDTTFSQAASFSKATFTQNADFRRATFGPGAVFSRATFGQIAEFSDTTFTGTASFQFVTFQETALWQRSRFLDRAEFRSTKFDSKTEGASSAVFALAQFSKPQEIIFDDVDLSRILFYNCDVSEVWFTTSALWGRRSGNRGLMVFEETIPLESHYAAGLQRNGQRDLLAVAQICQQLKKNYDSRLDYWTANEFHFGEMEMKRLDLPRTGRILRIRQCLHPRLSPVALYRLASDYGNSFWKPVAWLAGVLLIFALLLPVPRVGLKRHVSSGTETYSSLWNKSDRWIPNIEREGKIVAKAAIAAVDAVTFQRSAEYLPVYPWGRVLAIFTTLITSTLFALFLLAVHRQFKR